MSIAAQATETPYALTAANLGPFSTVWFYEQASDVVAWLDNGATLALLTQGVDYTLAGASPLTAGGAVTLSNTLLVAGAWPANYRLVLQRKQPFDQSSSYGQVPSFSPLGSEQALDHVAREVQQLATQMARALLLQPGEVVGAMPSKPLRINQVLGFDATGAWTIYAPGSAVAPAQNITFTEDDATAVGRNVRDKLRDIVGYADYAGGTLAAAIIGAGRVKPILTPDGGGYFPGPMIIDPDKFFATTMLPATSGRRGGLFVLTDPPFAQLDAGHSSSAQFWVGNNPTATPGGGDSVAVTIASTNGNSRSGLWGANILAGNSNLGAGWLDGNVVGLEIDVYGGWAGSNSPYSFSGGYGRVGLQLYTNSGSVGRATAAASIWSPDATLASAFYEGVSISRCIQYGVHFYKNPGGNADGTTAFAGAAIYDASDSSTVIKIDGTHNNILDMSGLTNTNSPTFRMPAGYNSDLLVTNQGDHATGMTIDSGSTAAWPAFITFSDRGTAEWQINKNNGNALFFVYQPGGANTNVLVMGPNGVGLGSANTIPGLDVTAGGLRIGAGLGNYANDAAAATGGVVIGQLYRNGSVAMIRVT